MTFATVAYLHVSCKIFVIIPECGQCSQCLATNMMRVKRNKCTNRECLEPLFFRCELPRVQLIKEILSSEEKHEFSQEEILQRIIERYPYCQSSPGNVWKLRVQETMRSYDAFVEIPQEGPGPTTALWKLNLATDTQTEGMGSNIFFCNFLRYLHRVCVKEHENSLW